jgi:uridine kinase
MLIYPLLIAVGGGSASGKSTVARELAERLDKGPAAVLEMDDYYKDLSRLTEDELAEWNFDHPEALDMDLLRRHLRDLKEGRGIEKPVYDFKAHQRKKESEKFKPAGIVIVEGLFALENTLKDLYAYRIFVDTSADLRFIRRMTRDIDERGRSFQKVTEQYLATVRPMHEMYVAVTAKNADIILSWDIYDEKALEGVVKEIRNLSQNFFNANGRKSNTN